MKQKNNKNRLSKNILSGLFVFLTVFALMALGAHAYTSPAAVDLGTAGNFIILAKSGVSTTGTTSITGDIGVSPIDSTAITGFGLIADSSNQFSTSSLVNGSIYAADYAPPTPAVMTTAISNMETAYTDAAGRAPDSTELGAGNIGGLTLAPGVYKWGTGVTIPTDVTLSGNSTDVWIFEIAQTLDISSGKQIILSGGAQAKNIYWQVAGQTTLGTTSVFNGNILDLKAIVINTGAKLNGRALAQTAVTLDANNVSLSGVTPSTDFLAPVVTLNTQNNSWTTNNQSIFNFTYFDAVSATASCSLFVNGVVRNASLSTAKNVNTTINTDATLAEGTYNWSVNCTDSSSNIGASAQRIINIDKTAPVVNLVSPGANNWSGSTFIFNYTDASIASCTLFAGGTFVGANNSVINNTNTVITANASLSQGSTSWYVNCTDQASNSDNSSTRAVFIDLFAPTATVNSVNSRTISGLGTINTTLNINFTANDTNIINWTLSLKNSTFELLENWTASTNNISTVVSYATGLNGTYFINLSVLDNASTTTTTLFNITVDQSNPIINSSSTSSITTSGATLTVNATDTYSGINNCTYSGAGSGILSLSSGLYTASLSGLSSSTSYTVTVTCNDKADNSVTSTTSFTTSATPSSSSSSSGGGGGGGGSAASEVSTPTGSVASASHGWNIISAGSVATMNINDPQIAVTRMVINAINLVTNPSLRIDSLADNPTATAAAQKVYQYFQVTPTTIVDSDVSSVTISFTVPNSWLASNSVQYGDIILYRYSNNRWNALPTTKTGTESSAQSYQGISPGFSYYAIGNNQPAATPLTSPAPTAQQTTTSGGTGQNTGTTAQNNNAIAPTGGNPITGQAVSQTGYLPPWWVTALVLLGVLGLIIGGYFYSNKPKGKSPKNPKQSDDSTDFQPEHKGKGHKYTTK